MTDDNPGLRKVLDDIDALLPPGAPSSADELGMPDAMRCSPVEQTEHPTEAPPTEHVRRYLPDWILHAAAGISATMDRLIAWANQVGTTAATNPQRNQHNCNTPDTRAATLIEARRNRNTGPSNPHGIDGRARRHQHPRRTPAPHARPGRPGATQVPATPRFSAADDLSLSHWSGPWDVLMAFDPATSAFAMGGGVCAAGRLRSTSLTRRPPLRLSGRPGSSLSHIVIRRTTTPPARFRRPGRAPDDHGFVAQDLAAGKRRWKDGTAMSTPGEPSQFSWRCERPESHERHRIRGDGYYGPAGYICDGEPRRQRENCRVYWGSHGCDLDRDHTGWHICGQSDPEGLCSTSRDWVDGDAGGQPHGMPLSGEDAMDADPERDFELRSLRFNGCPSGILDEDAPPRPHGEPVLVTERTGWDVAGDYRPAWAAGDWLRLTQGGTSIIGAVARTDGYAPNVVQMEGGVVVDLVGWTVERSGPAQP